LSVPPGTTRDASSPSASATVAGGSLTARFRQYLRERFPLLGYVPLITLFTFSSVAYSRLARGAPGFIPWPLFVTGVVTSLVCFFMLRVLDEHKDQDVDRRYRPELPVPRGLISLHDLRAIATAIVSLALIMNLIVAPVMLLPLAATGVWAALMTKEFFVRRWLRAHVFAYMVTHMAIMPLIDSYTTGLDWLTEGVHPPAAIGWFLAVTFFNGIVIELGRKIRAPGSEREGVDTYTRAWGLTIAPLAFIAALAASALTASMALGAIARADLLTVALLALASVAAAPAVRFLIERDERSARMVENSSRAWPLVTYFLLGAIPFAMRELSGR
jgi:4-hydroxybenzoate polyprenyltransferase